jgi:15-cis-phytoene synthase
MTKVHDAIYAIYGFVRLADEIVDTFHTHDKKELLARFKADTYQAIEEKISLNPILHSFQWAVNEFNMEHEFIEAFLYSMEMDLTKTHYNPEEYKRYIYGSAEVVG